MLQCFALLPCAPQGVVAWAGRVVDPGLEAAVKAALPAGALAKEQTNRKKKH